MVAADTKQGERTYLARTGSATWETWKPFSPPGLETLGDSAALLHGFATAMLTLQPSADDLILDLGAGGGWCADLLTKLHRQAVVVDISFDMLHAARGRPGVTRVAVGDMESLPFRSGSFRKALCFNALHHVPRMDVAVREIARVLDDGGVAFFSEPGEGHAAEAVSTAAMRDFGVLEQDVVIERLMSDCLDAGFVDVQVKPLANPVPLFGLSREQWAAWSRLADSTRPRRAWAKIALGFAEIFGLGKGGALFEDTFAISLVRTIRSVVERHPIVVASKRPLGPPTNRPPWHASLSVVEPIGRRPDGTLAIVVRLVNEGSATWPRATPSGLGVVAVGLQLLDAERRLVARDFHRELLPRPVAPGESVTVTCHFPDPPTGSRGPIKIDLVAEGITWFETAGSTALVVSMDVEGRR